MKPEGDLLPGQGAAASALLGAGGLGLGHVAAEENRMWIDIPEVELLPEDPLPLESRALAAFSAADLVDGVGDSPGDGRGERARPPDHHHHHYHHHHHHHYHHHYHHQQQHITCSAVTGSSRRNDSSQTC